MGDLGELLSKLPAVTPVGAVGTYVGYELYQKFVAPTFQMLGERGKKRIEEFLDKHRGKMPNPEEPFAHIPDRILVPAINEIAFLEDETLQEMWANLLANANTTDAVNLHPAFVLVLRQLRPIEAHIFDWIHHSYESMDQGTLHPLTIVEIERAYEVLCGEIPNMFTVSVILQNLEALALIEYRTDKESSRGRIGGWTLTIRGREFHRVCQSPTTAPSGDTEKPA